MKKYQVTATTFLRAGIVGLTAAQAGPRAFGLKAIEKNKDGGGIFEIVREVCFKAGEQIEFDGDLPKGLADRLQTPEEIAAAEKAAADAKAKAEADAKRGQLTAEVYDTAAARVFVKEVTLDFAVKGIASHYKADKKVVREELDTRLAAFAADPDAATKVLADAKAREEAAGKGQQ